MVEPMGLEPTTPALPAQCSPIELRSLTFPTLEPDDPWTPVPNRTIAIVADGNAAVKRDRRNTYFGMG